MVCIWCVSGCLQDGHRQRTVNWVDSTGGTNAAFDFTTKGILQEALGRSELWRLVDAQVQIVRCFGICVVVCCAECADTAMVFLAFRHISYAAYSMYTRVLS